MRVCVGQITARCENCGCEDFEPSHAEPPVHELVCVGCGMVTCRRVLLMQISEETVRRAQAFLELCRRQRAER